MQKIIRLCLLFFIFVMMLGCSQHQHKNTDPNMVRVGTIAGPETELMKTAQAVALKQSGLRIEIIPFQHYNLLNAALENDEIDANAFQHGPFLKSQLEKHGYSLAVVGNTFLYPMGLYSRAVSRLSDLKPGSKIAIPNDPSNEARALLLLQAAKLITLQSGVTTTATIDDVSDNPNHYQIVAMRAAELPMMLQDIPLAAINTNYALPAGLVPSRDALFLESRNSAYMNLIVVREGEEHEPKIQKLVHAIQSAPVAATAREIFGDDAVAGF